MGSNKEQIAGINTPTTMNWPKKALMVTPDFFNVEYAINPHMMNEKGELNTIDQKEAHRQWSALKKTFENLGLEILTINGEEGLPDMVFCANQCFPFLKEGQLNIVLSEMHSEQRKPEVPYFKTWAENENIPTHKLGDRPLEGMGDVIWDYSSGKIFGGYGLRTSIDTYPKLETLIDQEIIKFELLDEKFYHLDTCFSPLGNQTVAIVKEAFTDEGLKTISQHFKTVLEIPLEEAINQLACNLCCPNGKDVVIQQGANRTNKLLREHGYTIHEVNTSEFIKSGGSVFCMKMLLH